MTGTSLYLTPKPWPPFPLGGLFSPQRSRGANECGSFAPLFLILAFHGRRVGVLHLEPIGRAPRTVGGIFSLRDDAFEAKLAGMGVEDFHRAVFCVDATSERASYFLANRWAIGGVGHD